MPTLGYVNIIAGGTPQPLSATRVAAAQVVLTPKPGNAAVVYVGTKGMVTASGANVMGAIPKPASATTGPFQPFVLTAPTQLGGISLDQIYIDGSTNDGVYVAYT